MTKKNNKQIGEIEKKTVTTYDEKDQESKPEEISKAIKKVKPEDVSYNQDGTISVKENNVSEVERRQTLKFDLKKSQDVKVLQQMLDKKGIERGKVTVGSDGTISVSENVNRVIKADSFINTIKKYNKINLSESEIMSILVETQNPVMKKSELIESIQKNLLNEANMNNSVRQSFESGENDYSDILDSGLINQLAQESFREIADNIRRKTGKQNVTIDDVQSLLSTSLISAAKEEYRLGIQNLERKAVQMVSKEFNVPNGSVEFDVEITGLPVQFAPIVAQMSGLNRQQMLNVMELAQRPTPENLSQLSEILGVKFGEVKREGLKMEKGTKQPPQNKTHEELKPKVKRRRFTNAMIHGAARKAQNLHHLDDELRDQNPELGRNYANIMAANDASYFLLDDQTIKSQGESGIHAGNVRLDLSNRSKPKIIAQGMAFPILLHELAKGIVELISLHGSIVDKEEREYVADKTDNLESETNDIRLGTKMWERFVEQIPTDNQEVISLTWTMLQELPDYEFNSIIEGLIENRTEAQQKVRRLAEEALEELRAEASEDVFGGYEDSPTSDDDGDVATPEEEDDEEDDVLSGILGGQQGEEGPEETKDLNDMSVSELKNLLSSAIESEDYEFASQIRDILNRK